MFPDSLLTRAAIRSALLVLDAVPALAVLWLVAAHLCAPAPPAVVATVSLPPAVAAHWLIRLDWAFKLNSLWAGAEVLWWGGAKVATWTLDRRWYGQPGAAHAARLAPEERWRLWKSMLESTRDPSEWLRTAFLPKPHRHAPAGADDPAFAKVRLEAIGRTNIEEFIAHLLFDARLRNIKPRSLPRSELNAMVLLLEAKVTLAQPQGSGPFHFLRGRSPHRVFRLADEPLRTGHHPLVFYAAMAGISHIAYLALYLAGFRYYGGRGTWPFPLFSMRASTKSLEAALDPAEAAQMGDGRLAERVGYWYKPASRQMQEDDARPLVVCHGISGTFVITPFLLYLSKLSGRAIFLPQLPYVSMRLSPPSTILSRLEYVAAVRRMLWAHGFGLTCLERDEDDLSEDSSSDDGGPSGTKTEESWRRAKAIVLAHSFGTGAAAWLLRDAPDVIAGTVLVDPMSLLLHAADGPRNFFRTRARTASERFFRYFALERGISHYLARHLRWSDSVLFAGETGPAALPDRVVKALVPKCAQEPLEPPFDVPNYAPFVTPCPAGPVPTVVFLSERDCIEPVGKIAAYLEAAGFSSGRPADPAPSAASVSDGAVDGAVDGADSKGDTLKIEDATPDEAALQVRPSGPPSLYIMPRFEHGAILARPAWCRRVKDAIDRVEAAAAAWDAMDI